ncbi:hypothetical protein R3P38DRAFT_2770171 [Favolaschia claudopus]|uniref:Uncharacterized protein n=1 Tax=Favolaschia claudopus TaxID=2862362 RepID=A0AAW0CPI4_9AGAR
MPRLPKHTTRLSPLLLTRLPVSPLRSDKFFGVHDSTTTLLRSPSHTVFTASYDKDSDVKCGMTSKASTLPTSVYQRLRMIIVGSVTSRIIPSGGVIPAPGGGVNLGEWEHARQYRFCEETFTRENITNTILPYPEPIYHFYVNLAVSYHPTAVRGSDTADDWPLRSSRTRNWRVG